MKDMETDEPIAALDSETQNNVEVRVRLYEAAVQHIPVGLIVCEFENPDDRYSLRFVISNPAARTS
jgi:hypothetical protein